MTIMTDPPKGSFRLSMLLNDSRYRSLTLQAIAAILLALAIFYLANNVATNLTRLGLNIDFTFLGAPAGYDINQRLIEYTSQSTNLKAAFVGILNTLLVAFLACIMATIFGVLAGVLRLSNNWLVSKLMSFYVEIFRNIPVLIWILIIYGIMTVVMPAPRAFRGEGATSSMFMDIVAFTNRGVYTPKPIGDFASAIVLAVFLGSLIAMWWYRHYAKKVLYSSGRMLATFWPSVAILVLPKLLVLLVPTNSVLVLGVTALKLMVLAACFAALWWFANFLFRMVARDLGDLFAQIIVVTFTLLFLFLGGISFIWFLISATGVGELDTILTFDVPELKGFNFKGGIKIGAPLIAIWFALSIYTGAFIAENVRAGIQAVSKGQTEAAGALGIRPNRIMSLVVLPQALRVIIPPLISQYLNITKNSSLAILVGYADVTATLGGITLNQTGRAIECIVLLMLFYLVISLTISAVANVYNNSTKLKER
jgi:general L-amino acid transport system permease protein